MSQIGNNVPILFRVVKVIGEDVGMVDVEVGFPLEAVEVVFRLRPECQFVVGDSFPGDPIASPDRVTTTPFDEIFLTGANLRI